MVRTLETLKVHVLFKHVSILTFSVEHLTQRTPEEADGNVIRFADI